VANPSSAGFATTARPSSLNADPRLGACRNAVGILWQNGVGFGRPGFRFGFGAYLPSELHSNARVRAREAVAVNSRRSRPSHGPPGRGRSG
jgi:hypothetical protein